MKKSVVFNRKISSAQPLPTPEKLRELLPVSEKGIETVVNARANIRKILDGEDDRLLALVGPCSIHNMESAYEYAKNLKALSNELEDKLLIVMRTYFEKPRTVKGWKGFINDPHIDNTFKINEGLELARKFLISCSEIGLPAGTEMLDLISPQYVADLISWACIGARTTESQSHRELASGLSMPVGFKNGTKGSTILAVNAIKSAAISHHFLSVDDNGMATVFQTTGNKDCHIVLRGGTEPNYDMDSIARVTDELISNEVAPAIMVDCSHKNSNKDYTKQGAVCMDVVAQKASGNNAIKAIMLESNLNEGNQKIPANLDDLKYGVSITDSCISWSETEKLLREVASKL